MIWGAHGAQHPSDGSIRQHRMSENDMCIICIYAGQMMYDPASGWRPQQDSNLRSRLRRPLLSPLSYGGCATPKGTSRKPRANTSRCGALGAGPRCADSAVAARTGPKGRVLASPGANTNVSACAITRRERLRSRA